MKKKRKRFILRADEIEGLEHLIYLIDLMLTEDVSDLFTTPEEK
jgi:hypothetical protein